MAVLRISIEGGQGPRDSAVFGPRGGTLGRSDHNTLVLSDVERSVSRLHARVEWRDPRFVLVNMGLNPVIHNGAVLATADEVVLADGDVLRIGRFTLLVTQADDDAYVEDDEDPDDEALFDDMTGEPLPQRRPGWPDIALFDDSLAGAVPGGGAARDAVAQLLHGMGCTAPPLPSELTAQQAGELMRSAIEDTLRTWIPHCSPAAQQAWFASFEQALERVTRARAVVRQR